MKEVKIVLNDEGIQELLKSSGVQSFLQQKADQAANAARAAAGPEAEFESSVRVGRTRARASVITGNRAARVAESEGQALSRAGYSTGGQPGRG